MDGAICRKSVKKMLEVLVLRRPVWEHWALPGVSGMASSEDGGPPWGPLTLGCPCWGFLLHAPSVLRHLCLLSVGAPQGWT